MTVAGITDPTEQVLAEVNLANTHIHHINMGNRAGENTVEHFAELDHRLEQIIVSDIDNHSKRALLQKALDIPNVNVGSSGSAQAVQPGIQGSGILEALDRQGCNETPDKPSCIKLIENAENFELQIEAVAEGFEVSNTRLPPIVNIQPTEVTLGQKDHVVVEMPVFWWSEFERHQTEATIVEIKSDKDLIGLNFEGTPKKIFGTNDKVHVIVDGEFMPNPEEAVEVTMKVQVGDQVVTVKDMLFIHVADHETLTFFEQLELFFGF